MKSEEMHRTTWKHLSAGEKGLLMAIGIAFIAFVFLFIYAFWPVLLLGWFVVSSIRVLLRNETAGPSKKKSPFIAEASHSRSEPPAATWFGAPGKSANSFWGFES